MKPTLIELSNLSGEVPVEVMQVLATTRMVLSVLLAIVGTCKRSTKMVVVTIAHPARSLQEIRSHAKMPGVEMERFSTGRASALSVRLIKNHKVGVHGVVVIPAPVYWCLATMVAARHVLRRRRQLVMV